MKNTLSSFIVKSTKFIAPLALALAVTTANTTCLVFTYQPEAPENLKDFCKKNHYTGKK